MYSAMENIVLLSSSHLGIMRSLRDHPPSHYSVKVEPFSLLVKSQVEKHESGVFEVGGYKWKLILYPNGNRKADGVDHISLYLVMEDISSLPHRWEVNVDVKLFVFDQRRKKYLTIQDATRPIKRFHEMETEFGFAKLLALETFNNANSGYLVDDCCIFGAEVFVIHPTQKSECLSITEDPHSGTFSCKLNNRKITVHPERYDAEKGVLRSIRDLGPAHYSFKIKSFSSLCKQETENYESDIFEAGGFKWRLSLYPDGCKERNGSGYASLYLRIVETGNMAPNWEVNVIFKLFLYDKLRDKYLTIQDADGIVRRFHDIKTEWGFSQLISLDDFNDASNGYLVDDCCVFGAEVFIIKYTAKPDCSSTVKEPATNSYTWKIKNFSTLTKDSYTSDAFTIGEAKWKLRVYLEGDSKVKDKSVSIYLLLIDGESLPRNEEWQAKYMLKILDQVNKKHFELPGQTTFKYPSPTCWGFDDVISLTNLYDASKGYVKSDAVTIEVIFTELSMHRNFFKS